MSKNTPTVACKNCKKDVCFSLRDMRHYAHDVDGNNVYIVCPTCNQNISCWREAIFYGWVPRGD